MTTTLEEDLDIPLELWGALVHEARLTRKMSQPELAREAGVAQQTISKLERGMLCPHDKLKLRLATALDVQPAVLFPWPSLGELEVGRRRLPVP